MSNILNQDIHPSMVASDLDERTIRLTVDLSSDLHQQLSIAAAKQKLPKAVLVRQAIAQLLKALADDTLIG